MKVFGKMTRSCVLILSLLWLSACGSATQSPANNELTQVRLMSYNLWYANSNRHLWSLRKDKLVASILQAQPDLLGLQEADGPWMAELPKLLTDYAFVGVGRDDGKTSGEYSAIFYLKQKFELLDSGTFWLSDTPNTPSFGWGASNRRICTWAYLRNTETGEVIAHFNTHLDHESQQARHEGLALIQEKISASPYPVVLSGDLNFQQGSALYQELENSLLTDSKVAAKQSIGAATFNRLQPKARELGKVIDFIFVQQSAFHVSKYQVLTDAEFEHEAQHLPVSDHYPVVADLIMLRQE